MSTVEPGALKERIVFRGGVELDTQLQIDIGVLTQSSKTRDFSIT